MAYIFHTFQNLVDAIQAFARKTRRPFDGVYGVGEYGLHLYKDWAQNPEGQVNLYKRDLPIACFTVKQERVYIHSVDSHGTVEWNFERGENLQWRIGNRFSPEVGVFFEKFINEHLEKTPTAPASAPAPTMRDLLRWWDKTLLQGIRQFSECQGAMDVIKLTVNGVHHDDMAVSVTTATIIVTADKRKFWLVREGDGTFTGIYTDPDKTQIKKYDLESKCPGALRAEIQKFVTTGEVPEAFGFEEFKA